MMRADFTNNIFNMRFLIKYIGLSLLVITLSAYAADSFVVKDIRVEGLQGISPATVMSYLPVHVGERFDPSKSSSVIHALYQTGFFTNVSLVQSGSTLVVHVVESPVIASLDISGNKVIPKDKLNEVIKGLGLEQGRVLNSAVLEEVQHSLEAQYDSLGKYNARVTTQVTPLPRNRVAVKMDISEGRTAQVRQIQIIGNQTFSHSKLVGAMSLTTPHLWSFVTRGDLYSQDKLDKALDELRSYYMDRGYLKFKVDSTQATLTPDRNYIYLTIHVTEGPVYTFKGYKLISPIVFSSNEQQKSIDIVTGKNFSRAKIQEATQSLGKILGNMGYAFATVDPVPDVDENAKQVFVTFYVDPGHRVYVRRINISGNTKTEDVVLRRVMPQMEGGLVSVDDVKESERQLNLLGYMENVSTQTVAVPGVPDQVDLNYNMTEGPSAQAVAGIGYGTDGLVLNAGINQTNFMGTGKTVGINAERSKYATTYSFNYNNPYYTQDGIQRGFNLFATRITPGNINVTSYTSNQYGGTINYSIPISAKGDSLQLGYGYQITNLSLGSNPSVQLNNFINANGAHFQQGLLTGGWSRNSLDRAFLPTQGTYQSLGAFVSVPGGAANPMEYYKLTYSGNYYQSIAAGFIVMGRANLGYGNGFGSTKGLPFFANYFAGGPEGVQGQVRGYETNTLGPQDSLGDPMGGNKLATGTLAIIFPNPFEADKLRTSVFMDGGNVYSTLPQNLGGTPSGPPRYSAGLAIDWQVPVMNFMINLSVAKPLNRQRGDQAEPFQFNIGTNF
jgi:outer membrane protein insertion porin family